MIKQRFLNLIVLAVCVLSPSTGQTWAETVRLLTIGNSFADNALTYLSEIADADGHELIAGRANLGGCTLERHWRHVSQHEADPGSREGSPYGGGRHSLADMLAMEKWDYITIQQVSFKSHDLETYAPYAKNLHAYIVEHAPEAGILAHQIWAYRVDDPRFVPGNEGKEPHTQEVMYRRVRAAYHTIADELGIGIIPGGDAMFLADTDPIRGYQPDRSFDFDAATFPHLPNQTRSLHAGWRWAKDDSGKQSLRMDGHHASDAGKYLIGCVWYETLFGEDVSENPFVPDGLDASYARFLRETAHKAVSAATSTP